MSLSLSLSQSQSQSQCVPSWDLDENPNHVRASVRSRSISTAPNVPMVDFEVAELTWENGQLSMHGLLPPRLPAPKPSANNTTTCATNPKYTWEKQPRVTGTGTLESIVNQATSLPLKQPSSDDLPLPGSRIDQRRSAAAATMAMDALVPCSNLSQDRTTTHALDPVPRLGGTCAADCSTRVDSCSGAFPPVPSTTKDDQQDVVLKGGKRARLVPEWSGSATFGMDRDCQHRDTCEYDLETGVGFTTTSTSMESPENTSSAAKQLTNRTVTTADDHDSVCHSRPLREAGDKGDKKKGNGNCSVSTKRSRAAAIHNQSERKRRDKINQRMKTLQKLVPNSSKTDKASMLDEVIDYLKQLQAQVQMMGRMNMPPDMMLPMAMQQQLHMSMLASMGMTMGMGMGMGMAGVNVMDMSRPNITGMPPVVPPHFMPLPSWDGSAAGDSWLQAAVPPMTDPLSTFLPCQSQPMTMDAYTRMAVMYQQMQQQQQDPPAASSKS